MYQKIQFFLLSFGLSKKSPELTHTTNACESFQKYYNSCFVKLISTKSYKLMETFKSNLYNPIAFKNNLNIILGKYQFTLPIVTILWD